MNKKEKSLQQFSEEYGIGKKRIQYYKKFWGGSNVFIKHKIKYKTEMKIKNKLNLILYGNSLMNSIKNKIKIMQNIKSLKGICHLLVLPTRGQRTHTNGKTRKKHKILF